jgi:hypothetical protein
MGGKLHRLNNKGQFSAHSRFEIIEPKKGKLNTYCDFVIFRGHSCVSRAATVVTGPRQRNTSCTSACQTASAFL